MALSLVLALQAASVPAATPTPSPQRWAVPARAAGEGIAFDLAAYRAAGGPCAGAGGDEVVVCGRRSGGDYPMARWARVFGPETPIRAEMGLGGNLTGRIYTESVPMLRGEVSERVMVGIRMPF